MASLNIHKRKKEKYIYINKIKLMSFDTNGTFLVVEFNVNISYCCILSCVSVLRPLSLTWEIITSN